MMSAPCLHCDHRHEGPELAGICVGCPCEYRPADRGLTVEQVEHLRQLVTAMMLRTHAPDAERDGHAATLRIIGELLAEADRYTAATVPPVGVFHHGHRPDEA